MTNEQINEIMVDFPDLIATAEKTFKESRVERERTEALVYFRLKAETAEQKVTEKWLEYRVRADTDVHKAKLLEIVNESEYNRLYEKLMCAKKMAALRTAF